jgi:hypothetical protein
MNADKTYIKINGRWKSIDTFLKYHILKPDFIYEVKRWKQCQSTE